MDELPTSATTDSVLVSEAFSAARELLRQAEEDAARIRSDADRYKRQREQEAELLVGKARRLLTMAEERAAAMGRVVVDLDAPAPIEAPAPAEPVASVPASRPAPAHQAAPRLHSQLDSILANAVSNAVHRAMPVDD